VYHEEVKKHLPAIQEILKDMDRDELITHFVSTQFHHYLESYKDAKDLNVDGGGYG